MANCADQATRHRQIPQSLQNQDGTCGHVLAGWHQLLLNDLFSTGCLRLGGFFGCSEEDTGTFCHRAPLCVCTYLLRSLCSNIDDQQLCHRAHTASATALLHSPSDMGAPSEKRRCSSQSSISRKRHSGRSAWRAGRLVGVSSSMYMGVRSKTTVDV